MSSPGCRPSPPELNNATIKHSTLNREVLLRFKEDLLRHFSCRSLPSIPTQVRWRLERLWDLYTTLAYWISHSTGYGQPDAVNLGIHSNSALGRVAAVRFRERKLAGLPGQQLLLTSSPDLSSTPTPQSGGAHICFLDLHRLYGVPPLQRHSYTSIVSTAGGGIANYLHRHHRHNLRMSSTCPPAHLSS